VCKSIGLVIEVDGEIHHYSQVADTARTKIIETDYNYRLLRLSNQEVLEEWSLVEDKILALIR
jgi:very-short-patch-repair endonuclease